MCNNFRLDGGYTAIINYWWDNDVGALMGAGALNDGAWRSVVGTWDSVTRSIYIDGVLQAWDRPAPIIVVLSQFVVGRSLGNPRFTGWIDELLIASYAFTAEQSANFYASGYFGPICSTGVRS